jgi:N-acetylneuraminic acid mutarotase
MNFFTLPVGQAMTSVAPNLSGTTDSVSFSVSPSLPAGLSLDLSTGVISGTPTQVSGPQDYVVTASTPDSGSASTTLTIKVFSMLVITYTGSPFSFNQDTTISSISPTVSGGTIATCSISPNLPAGLSLSNTCMISGIPTVASPMTTYTVSGATGDGAVGSAFIQMAVVGSASQLAFGVAPSTMATAGVPLPVQPLIQVQDSVGNPVAVSTPQITLSAYQDATCTTAYTEMSADTNPLSPSAGIAQFTGVTFTHSGPVYLKATAGSWVSPCSSPVAVIAATPSALVFSSGTSSVETTELSFATQPVLELRDSYGNAVSSWSNPATLTAYTDVNCSNPSSGALGAALNPVTPSGGSATFSNVSFSTRGAIYLKAETAGFSTCSNAIVMKGAWTWKSGMSTSGSAGIYGTLGSASASFVPGSRQYAATWTDSSGKLWLFGGSGYDSGSTLGYLNDLWKFDPVTGSWSWISGSQSAGAPGVYGTQNQANASNVPGGRMSAVTWVDNTGKLWLFGGKGIDANANTGVLSDLWMFDPLSKQWTWVSGPKVNGQVGSFGTPGMLSSGNVPSSREEAVAWTDISGNFWLFGGYGDDSVGTVGNLNDLWKYDVAAHQWAWMGGTELSDQTGVWGSQGVPSTSNYPGARASAVSWVDPVSGDLWLFGGNGEDASSSAGDLNDLWKYKISTGEWTWVDGSSSAGAAGTYGTQGVEGSNAPGARAGGVAWSDPAGYLWLMGGSNLNDLWRFNLGNHEWMWVGGAETAFQTSSYGTKGIKATTNLPGSRIGASAWSTSNGRFWFFGGGQSTAYYNDLWTYY